MTHAVAGGVQREDLGARQHREVEVDACESATAARRRRLALRDQGGKMSGRVLKGHLKCVANELLVVGHILRRARLRERKRAGSGEMEARKGCIREKCRKDGRALRAVQRRRGFEAGLIKYLRGAAAENMQVPLPPRARLACNSHHGRRCGDGSRTCFKILQLPRTGEDINSGGQNRGVEQ